MCYRIPDDNSYRKPDLTMERQGFCRKEHGKRWVSILMCLNIGDSPTRTCCLPDCTTWCLRALKHLRDSCSRNLWQAPRWEPRLLTVLFAAISINQPTVIEHIWQKEHSPPAGSMLRKACREKVSILLCMFHTQHIPGCSGLVSRSRTHPTLPCCRPSP